MADRRYRRRERQEVKVHFGVGGRAVQHCTIRGWDRADEVHMFRVDWVHRGRRGGDRST
jgi:hypothetical protein